MKKYLVDLTDDERAALQAVVRRGRAQARKVTRARILLHAASGAADSEIVTALGVATVERTRRRFVEEGLEALNERPRPGALTRCRSHGRRRLADIAGSASDVQPSNTPKSNSHK